MMRPELESKYLEQKKRIELFYKKAEEGKLKNAIDYGEIDRWMR